MNVVHPWRWLNKLLVIPPHLPGDYDTSGYAHFMREETFLFTPKYARQSVVIHGGHILNETTKRRGAILASVHYGSFFLSSGAIVHQLKLPCTDIVTSRNLTALPAEEGAFWRGVHQRSARLYGQPLFHAGITPPREMVRYLSKPKNLLLAMLDVRESGNIAKESPFSFLQKQIYLQTGPARLARLAGVPFVPMCIRYEPEERRHHLYLGLPISSENSPIEMTQQAIAQLERYVAGQPRQFFHDMSLFQEPLHQS